MKKILYIGNNLTKKTRYYSSMELLYRKLQEEGYTVYVSSNKRNKFLRILDMLYAVLKYSKKADIILIDTFSTSNFYYAYATSQLARVLNKRYIPILRGGNLPHRLEKNATLCKAIFKHSYKNVAPSNYLKTAFEKYGYETLFIPNILEIKNYTFKERKKLKPNILYVRAFDKIYNPTMAIKVLQSVKQKFPEAKLCMIGPVKDHSYEETKELVKKLELENAVEFTGVLTKEAWHKKAEDYDVFINTTNFDNTPVSVMEIMALGLPVVSTNAGGLPYLIDDKKDGILVNKNDVEAMSDHIIRLIENPSDALQLTKKAKEKVNGFDWDQVKQKWHAIINA